SVVVLHIPPLRERREDIPVLFGHFLMQAAARYERSVPDVSGAWMQQLMAHHWPGNVRELRNAADRMVLGLPVFEKRDGDATSGRSLDEQVSMFERHLIEEAMSASGGRAAGASELLRMPKKT